MTKEFTHKIDFEDMKLTTDILHHSGTNAEEKKKLETEQEAWRTVDAMTGGLREKVTQQNKEIAAKNQALAEKDQALKQKDEALNQKNQALNQKNQALNQKVQALAEKDKQIAELLLKLKEKK